MRQIAGALALGSVIAFFVGTVNLSGYVQIGGDSGFILHGSHVVLSSLLLGVGAGLFLSGYRPGMGFTQPRVLGGLALMAAAAVVLITLGQTSMEYCGQLSCP